MRENLQVEAHPYLTLPASSLKRSPGSSLQEADGVTPWWGFLLWQKNVYDPLIKGSAPWAETTIGLCSLLRTKEGARIENQGR